MEERFGVTQQRVRALEKRYAEKGERQALRWQGLVPFVRGDLVVFPPVSESIKRALRKGLPRSLRANAWYFYSGAQRCHEAEPKQYAELIGASASYSSYTLFTSQIDSEVLRTFSNNRRFQSIAVSSAGPAALGLPSEPLSQSALRRILVATAAAFPAVGYTSGLNFIAATLLLVTQDEVRSFWVLSCILSKRLPENYFTEMNLGCNVDQEVLATLLAWKLPQVHKKLQELQMSLHILTSDWFTHLFVDQLPFESLLRVWDCLLLEGSKVLFRVALALFKLHQDEILAQTDPFDLASFIKSMPRRQLDSVVLMDTAFNKIGRLSSAWLSSERTRVTPYWRAKHAVRRFSRVSPAYCQALGSTDYARTSSFAPVIVVTADPPSPAAAAPVKSSPSAFAASLARSDSTTSLPPPLSPRLSQSRSPPPSPSPSKSPSQSSSLSTSFSYLALSHSSDSESLE